MNVNSITRLDSSSNEGQSYYEGEGISVGLQHGPAFEGELTQTACEEFVHVLKGSITVEREGGHLEQFDAGQTFVIPKGLSCSRNASVDLKAYVMRFEDKASLPHQNVEEIGVIRLNASAEVEEFTIADHSQFLGNVPRHFKHAYYTDTSGRFLVAKWASDAFERDVAPFNRYELMLFLEGSVTLSDGAEIAETFGTSDVSFVPHQVPYKWKSDEYLSKIYCIVMPK